MANPAVDPLTSLPPTRSGSSSEIDPAGAHPNPQRSGTGPKRALERLPPSPLAPSARKPNSSPRSLRAQDQSRWSPPTNPSSAAGPGRSEHWNVHHLPPSRVQRESPTSSPRSLRAQDRSRGAHPQTRQAQRDRAEASIGTSTTYPPRAFSAKAQPIPTFPANAGPIPRSPPAHSPSDVGL